MSGGLYDPLGTGGGAPAPRRVTAPVLVAGAALAAFALLAAVAWLRDDGDRGRPVAVAPIDHIAAPPRPAPPPAVPEPPTPSPPAAAAGPPSATPTGAPGLPPVAADQEVEVQNGVRVVRPRRAAPGAGGQTLAVPAGR